MTDARRPPDDVLARRLRVRGEPEQRQWRRGLIGATPSPSLESHGESWRERHWSSRTLHRLGEVTAHAGAGLVAASAVIVRLVVGVASGFPDWWETVLYATSASVTLVMVF